MPIAVLLRMVALQLLRLAYIRTAYSRRLLVFGVAFAAIAFGALYLVEDSTGDSYAGAGTAILALAILLPNIVRLREGRRPWRALLLVSAQLGILAAARAFGVDVPVFAFMLIGAGVWLLARTLRPPRRPAASRGMPVPTTTVPRPPASGQSPRSP